VLLRPLEEFWLWVPVIELDLIHGWPDGDSRRCQVLQPSNIEAEGNYIEQQVQVIVAVSCLLANANVPNLPNSHHFL
jgi:hypothetical protein